MNVTKNCKVVKSLLKSHRKYESYSVDKFENFYPIDQNFILNLFIWNVVQKLYNKIYFPI